MSGAGDPAGGTLLVPLYVHPAVDPAAWRALEALGPRLYGVVVNAADGPGPRVDGVMAQAASRLRGAGIRLLGYVDTRYGKRPPVAALRDLRRHRVWYGVDGVFFDQVSAGPEQLPYYRRLGWAARRCGARAVVLNPGVHPHPGYAALADVLVTFEGSWERYAEVRVPGWTAGLRPARLCHLVYDVPPGEGVTVARTAARLGAGVHCAVPDGPPNPWRHVPGGAA
ncbi:spherulation-specific family 4 protein [Actinacidiphila sp. ITFR-21]|uniref:spherulation-specific family 4 protein n=1 Tax=Actinacidiphila sp. ITFR-21 TaxID=3075199 RepID=UPI00288B9E35|nr:spherulation-specific family 4 protein [Streptomyces sp. ITFR-21]WNI14553.1 spherulation-specific family 4 protein [Streptomyces sp. ITFR-21]